VAKHKGVEFRYFLAYRRGRRREFCLQGMAEKAEEGKNKWEIQLATQEFQNDFKAESSPFPLVSTEPSGFLWNKWKRIQHF
jgi:hypothetical protein